MAREMGGSYLLPDGGLGVLDGAHDLEEVAGAGVVGVGVGHSGDAEMGGGRNPRLGSAPVAVGECLSAAANSTRNNFLICASNKE